MAPINVVFYLAIFTNGQVLKHARAGVAERAPRAGAPPRRAPRRERSYDDSRFRGLVGDEVK